MQYDLLEILLKNAQPIAGYTIQTLASAFISALFLKGNTARTELLHQIWKALMQNLKK